MLTQQELEDNVQYVLGMTTHYNKDSEIHDMLRLKGMDEADIQKILRTVAYSFNVKRMQQHKRSFIFSSIAFVFLDLIPGLLALLLYVGVEIGYLNIYLLFIISAPFLYGLVVLVPCWLVYSVYSYNKYKKRMKQEENIGAIGLI